MMDKNALNEYEQIAYSDLEPFFIAIAKELGRHAYGIDGKHLSYRHKMWGDSPAQEVILHCLKEKPIEELETNPSDSLDRAAYLGWFWLHVNDLMPEWEMSPGEKAWYNLATQGMR